MGYDLGVICRNILALVLLAGLLICCSSPQEPVKRHTKAVTSYGQDIERARDLNTPSAEEQASRDQAQELLKD